MLSFTKQTIGFDHPKSMRSKHKIINFYFLDLPNMSMPIPASETLLVNRNYEPLGPNPHTNPFLRKQGVDIITHVSGEVTVELPVGCFTTGVDLGTGNTLPDAYTPLLAASNIQ